MHVIASLLGHPGLDTVMIYAKLYPDTLVDGYRTAMRGLYGAVYDPDQLTDPSSDDWAAFTASCNLRDMGTHICALPTGEHCSRGLVCLGCVHAQPKKSAAPTFRRMIASHTRAFTKAHEAGEPAGQLAAREIEIQRLRTVIGTRRRTQPHRRRRPRSRSNLTLALPDKSEEDDGMQSTTYFGSGDENPPTEADLEAWRIRGERPDNEIGWGLPVSVVLASTHDAAVAVTHMTAFTTGVAFNLAVRLRVARDGLDRGGLYELISPYGPPKGNIELDRRLLIGVEYADGRTATNLSPNGWPPKHHDNREPTLMANGGGGGELSVDNAFWLSPVPPDGPFTFMCSWPAFGIEETRRVIEHADLTTASTRSTTLWARQPINHEPPPPPPEPALPTTGWFGQAARHLRDNER